MGFLFSLFIFMPLLFLLAHSSPFIQPLCHRDESSALLQFKESFIIDESASSFPVILRQSTCQKVASWKVEGNKSDCCSWDGVECDEGTGHVIGLDLSGSCLKGSINSNNSLFRLVHLQRLNLAYNDFNLSQIPFGVGNLLRLTHLNLSDSRFSGQIPLGVLSHLSKLSSLDLSDNFGLYAESDLLRSSAQNFTSLEELLLSYVNISSVLPESLANLSSLTTLELVSCALQGEFPTRIFQLPNLRDLSIGGNENLTGQLPEFHSNSSLEVLWLWGSSFYGKLPNSIGNLRSLQDLDFESCHFSGSIPPSLSNLTQLTFLDLSWNNLTGHIPSSLPSNMTQLTTLILSNNNLEGTIPSSFSELKSIEYLYFSYNNLEGTIPSSFSELKSIKYLYFSYNNLEGTIPSSFSELKSIETLDFSHNNLSGMLELDMFLKIKSLKDLYLSSNNLTLLTKANSNDTLAQFVYLDLASCNLRKFPDFLRNQNILHYLDLANNHLQGLIPKWFSNASIESLVHINLSENFLIGFEQSSIVLRWSKLIFLDLGNNRLEGSLPIPPPPTVIYRVQRNLIREMSPLICNLSFLCILDLSYNNLSGMLHPCLGNLSSPFFELQLRSNNFHGTIPKTWSKGSNLKMIDLSENQLQGQLPRSMANCTMLEYLHVGNNHINDTFPFWLGTLSQLKVLILRSNAFYGAIKSPEINYTFPELHIIDLSHNSFSGKLPTEYFVHWNAMKFVSVNDQLLYMEGSFYPKGRDGESFDYPVTMINKGIKLEYEEIPNVFMAIDFSSNRFEGEIPKLVGSLKGLHLLNLSNNALTGHIPSSLGNLTNIEAMDLSQNKLLGEIPPQLTQLFFLEYFDVSNNNLTGPIPHGNQFDTFQNSSFGGNRLCGSPLSKKCGDFKYTPTPPPFEENQSSESPFEFGWKIVVIGYGCGFVIGIVIGKIVIARKYEWFVKIFGRM